jgi:nucleoside-diphosphate kinase
LEGVNVVRAARQIIGATKPIESAPGTIRGDFALEVGRNLIHGSDSVDSAKREIATWFDAKEIATWAKVDEPWVYEH